MPRAKTTKLYRTFVKGLITEAGYLTYPADSSVDELNTVLSRKGNRTRRQGIKYEQNFVLNPLPVIPDYAAIQEFLWHSVAKAPALARLVVQIGSVIYFWEVDETPLSDKKTPYTINLLDFKSPTASEADVVSHAVDFAAGAGFLFAAHPYCEPLAIEYEVATGAITATKVIIQIRDFQGTYDGLANDEEPGALSKEHLYNLLNQGWVSPGTLPPVTDGLGGGSGTYYDPYTGGSRPYSGGGGVLRDGNNLNVDLV